MEIQVFKKIRDWDDVYDACLTTINKKSSRTPSNTWKAKMILARHSPLRLIEFDWKWIGLKSWVATHFARHHVGVEKFVGTQRTDRTGVNREDLPQGELVNVRYTANANALLNMSEVRLCSCASKETRQAWKAVISEVAKEEPILAEKCVPSCVARGFCTEFFNPCGYDKTEAFKEAVKKYRNVDYD